MCEQMTSHLYDRVERKAVCACNHSHSRNRELLGIGDKDSRYLEVEQHVGQPEPSIRWDERMDSDERQVVRDYYARAMATRQSMIRWCAEHATDVHVVEDADWVLEHLPPGVTHLDVLGCSGLTALTVPPGVTHLDVLGCSGLTALPVPPGVTHLDVLSCSGLTALTVPPGVTHLDVWNCPKINNRPTKEVNHGPQ